MFLLSVNFEKAVKDYLYLLERGYPQKSILKIVGDKYQLVSRERSMLFRGVVTQKDCGLRKSKSLDMTEEDSSLYVDGYNVIRTIGSYLLGKPVFIAMDGFLRDAAEMHRSTLQKKILNRTLDLLVRYLASVHPGEVIIYLDEPVSKSGQLATRLNELLQQNALTGNALTTHSPDHHLKSVSQGIVCTADSAVIDNCKTKVFDLAQAILDLTFQPEYITFETDINH
ncbi:MAG TPA: DUF434 domain-containing protein [Bacteroidetes bacterium]|nr:DUF434 domain-containing protein [Bacteroidota bacterium]